MTFSLCQQFLTDFSAADSEQSPLNFGFTLPDSDWSRPESSNWKADLCGLQTTKPVFTDVPTAFTSFVEENFICASESLTLLSLMYQFSMNARGVFKVTSMGESLFFHTFLL